MNYYFLVSGILMILGGFAHTIVGERKVISKLKTQKERQDFPDNEAFNLIRWFWYMGSFVSFWVGVVALLLVFRPDWFGNTALIGTLLATFMLGFSVITFGIVAFLNPKDLGKISQVWILILVTVLLFLGAS